MQGDRQNTDCVAVEQHKLGSLFSWGLDDSHRTARLGGDDTAPQLMLPHLQVAAGGSSSSPTAAAAGAAPTPTSSSNLTASGSHGWRCHSGTPGLVTALAGVKAVAAAAGRYSTLVLDDAGHLWVWGYDGCAGGQLPAQGGAWRPRSVAGALASKKVVAFDVGYTFWLAATADGELYTCDTMDDGYAGTPHQPGRVDSLLSKRITAVAAGREHGLVATSEGQVFSFGGSSAVLGRDGQPGVPGLVAGALAGMHVRHVAAGEYFSVAATDSQVFAWGSNAYHCLGTGDSSITELQQPTADWVAAQQ
ncbi:regulator of chromosome condensation 1/beta-lactamase-inhibitor protein II [Scenedesmus sp. NREL 46B-D3]|nr:regulator of chromosome condensation 1/beta-lactamase-inhibitor protein II [Scenedesmus sp. NREL 46B-D3]